MLVGVHVFVRNDDDDGDEKMSLQVSLKKHLYSFTKLCQVSKLKK